MTIKLSSHFDSKNKQTHPQLLVVANFITCLPREIPRDTAFIPCKKMAGIVYKVCFIQMTYNILSKLCTYQCQAWGGLRVGQVVGNMTFSEKNESNSPPQGQHNWSVIKITHPGASKGDQIPFRPCCTQEEYSAEIKLQQSQQNHITAKSVWFISFLFQALFRKEN